MRLINFLELYVVDLLDWAYSLSLGLMQDNLIFKFVDEKKQQKSMVNDNSYGYAEGIVIE